MTEPRRRSSDPSHKRPGPENGDRQTYQLCLEKLWRELTLNQHDFPTLDSVIAWAKEMHEGYVQNELKETPPTREAEALRLVPHGVSHPQAPNEFHIRKVCTQLADFLCAKNAAYGDSAINPLRVLSKADPAEQIRVRMDDKISRMVRGQAAGEDALKALVGYWVLLQVLEDQEREAEKL
jgi:hypothetical protein